METIGLRNPDWDRSQGGDVGETPKARATKWHRDRAKKARAALKRGERREDRIIQEEFERAMMDEPRPRKRRTGKAKKRGTVAKRQTSRKKQRPAQKRGRRRK